jgi:hypothetical protein
MNTTTAFGWQPARSKTGSVKAVGTGEHAGQVLYGADAERALKAGQKPTGAAVRDALTTAARRAVGGGLNPRALAVAGRRAARQVAAAAPELAGEARAAGRAAKAAGKATAKGAKTAARATSAADRALGSLGAWTGRKVLAGVDLVQDWGNLAADANSKLAKLTVKYPAMAVRGVGDARVLGWQPTSFFRVWYKNLLEASNYARTNGAAAGAGRLALSGYGYFGANFDKNKRRFGLQGARLAEVVTFALNTFGPKMLLGAAVGGAVGGIPGAIAGAKVGLGFAAARLATPMPQTPGLTMLTKPVTTRLVNKAAKAVLGNRQKAAALTPGTRRNRAANRLRAAGKVVVLAETPPEPLTIAALVREASARLGRPVSARQVAVLVAMLLDDAEPEGLPA